MHNLSISLQNKDGLRLTVGVNAIQRNTATENYLRQSTEFDINQSEDHKKYGPWIVFSSKWES